MSARDLTLLAALLAAAALAAVLNVAAGDAAVSIGDLAAALFGGGDPVHVAIAQEIRAPRAAAAFVVGAGLAAAGAALQGYFRNPLADPGIIGVAPSAALGAVIALYFGAAVANPVVVSGAALAGAFAGACALFALAGRAPRPTTLILAGVAVSALAGALVALAMNLSPNPWALSEIAYWLMGSVRDRGWSDVALAAPLIAAGVAALLFIAGDLDALTLGHETALTLGVDPFRTRAVLILGALLCVGPGVAIAGTIGFVGLVTPHLVRPFVASEPGRLILPSAVAGGALTLVADAAVDALTHAGTPLYLGVFTALVGAPFFLWLVRANREDMA